MAASNVLTKRASSFLGQFGEMAALGLEAFRHTPAVRQWWGEFLAQAWFLVKVTSIPVIFVSIPLGATISLQVGDLARQLGAQSATGAVVVVAIVREVAPVATALLIAGAGGSAISADMGARNIRDELSAMEVMGVDVIARLVTPRLWAASVVGTLLVSLVIVAGVSGGYIFNVLLQGVTPGAYFTGATSLLQLPDLLQSLVKAFIFGVIAAIVACHRGMHCGGGPVGVGRAVNQAVVQTFILVFAANYVLTTLYFAIVPQRI